MSEWTGRAWHWLSCKSSGTRLDCMGGFSLREWVVWASGTRKLAVLVVAVLGEERPRVVVAALELGLW